MTALWEKLAKSGLFVGIQMNQEVRLPKTDELRRKHRLESGTRRQVPAGRIPQHILFRLNVVGVEEKRAALCPAQDLGERHTEEVIAMDDIEPLAGKAGGHRAISGKA